MTRIRATILFLLLFGGSICQAQVSTEGRDFWFGFMTNWLQDPNNPISLQVYITGADSTAGTITIPGDATFNPISFTVVPGITTRILIPSQDMAAGSEFIERKSIHVTTNDDVSVFAMNTRQFSADMTGICPTYSLGNNYIVMSHWENDNRLNNTVSHAEFLVVAISNGTLLQITPSVATLNGKPANVPFTVTLNAGEMYQVQAGGDLSGTKVTGTNAAGGCENFALFAGNMYTKVGNCNNSENGHDHMFAQQYPVNTWGREFVTVSLASRAGGDIIKLLASEDQTTVNINGSPLVLNTAESVEVLLDGVNNISADKPICVGQFSRSQSCDNNSNGDPFFIVISPIEQMLRKITFDCPVILSADPNNPGNTLVVYRLTVITRTTDVPGTTLDGRSISSSFVQVPGNATYSYARFVTTSGTHTIQSNGHFAAYVYAFGPNESFGYSAGASLESLNVKVLIQNSQMKVIPPDSLCVNDNIFFTPEVDGPNHFEWNFGDGTKITTEGKKTVSHKFTKPGKYVLLLKVSIGGTNCVQGFQQTFVKIIYVVKPKTKILGPRSVCPNAKAVKYAVDAKRPYSYYWAIRGGTITQNFDDSIYVDWGNTNPKAFIKILARDYEGCYGDTLTFPVKINTKLEPEAPLGPDTLCSASMTNIPYSTFFTQGSTYVWSIDGGLINSGQTTSSIDVSWSAPGINKLWFLQNTVTDSICAGVSDTLYVYIQRAPSTVAIVHTDKTEYEIGEPVMYTIEADTLYQKVNWTFGDGLVADTVLRGPITHAFACSGDYTTSILVFDTVGICPTTATGETKLKVLPLSFEMIQVTTPESTDSVLQVVWKTEHTSFMDKAVTLQRREKDSVGPWNSIKTLDGVTTNIIDKEVKPKTTTYEYRLTQATTCIDQDPTIPQHNIVLEATSEDNLKTNLNWEPYEGWKQDVDHYEVYLRIDKGVFSLIGFTNTPTFTTPFDSSGFDYCFRVKALEKSGNNAFSWSNIDCAYFAPPVYVYNVITPFDEDLNQRFTIKGIEYYPNSKLILFNRWGRTVKTFHGYKNDWPNDNVELPERGVYYYVLELNDARAKQQTIKGTLSIL